MCQVKSSSSIQNLFLDEGPKLPSVPEGPLDKDSRSPSLKGKRNLGKLDPHSQPNWANWAPNFHGSQFATERKVANWTRLTSENLRHNPEIALTQLLNFCDHYHTQNWKPLLTMACVPYHIALVFEQDGVLILPNC